MKFRLISVGIAALSMVGFLGGCGGKSSSSKVLKVGTTAGPQSVILKFVRDHAKRNDKVNIKIVEFNDYILPNAALDAGDLDANFYQHIPFLEEQIKNRCYELTPIAKTILLPIGLYSEKHDSLDKLGEKMNIGIPNDPTNGGRALLLLEKSGMITLKPGTGHTPTLRDIVDNPMKLKFIELEAPQLPLALTDLDYAVINTDWILVSGRNPEDAVYREEADSPYTNVIVVRSDFSDDPRFQALVESYQSEATKTFIKEKYGSAIIPGWE